MSNPAVITLVTEHITRLGTLKIEDNIGESIHIHLGDFRFDLTLSEFGVLVADIEGLSGKLFNENEMFLVNHCPSLMLKVFQSNIHFKESSKKECFYIKRSSCFSRIPFMTFSNKCNYYFNPLYFTSSEKFDQLIESFSRCGNNQVELRSKLGLNLNVTSSSISGTGAHYVFSSYKIDIMLVTFVIKRSLHGLIGFVKKLIRSVI
jgi:hypothetical protein